MRLGCSTWRPREEVDFVLDEAELKMKKNMTASTEPASGNRKKMIVVRQIAPKGYMYILDLLAKVVRNLEYMEAGYKIKLIDSLIVRWSLITKRGIEEWDSVAEEFIEQLDIGSSPKTKDFRGHMKSLGRKVVPIGFAAMFARGVANPILNGIFTRVANDKGRMWLEQFFAFAALLEADVPSGFAAGRELVALVREEKPVGWKFLLHLMAGRLYELRDSRALPRELHDTFTSLAVEIELGLGLPRSRRNSRASDIRGELVKGLVKH